MLDVLVKIKETYTKIVISACAVVSFVILGVNFVQVIVRYLTSISFTITEDLTIFGMLWMMATGLSVGCMHHDHLVINVLDSIVSEKTLKVVLFVEDIILVVFGIFMAYVGFLAAKLNKGFVQSMLGIDEVHKYVPVIAGGILCSLGCIECLLEQICRWRKEKKEKMENKEVVV